MELFWNNNKYGLSQVCSHIVRFSLYQISLYVWKLLYEAAVPLIKHCSESHKPVGLKVMMKLVTV